MWYRTRVSESAPAAGRTTVTLGTATPGGGFPVYGQAVADTINEVDADARREPRNTKGWTENVPLLEAGALDMALVQGEVVHEALTGVGRAPADLRILAAMYSTPGMFVVRADAPYRSIDDLKGSRSRSGRAARGSSSSRATCWTASASTANGTSRPFSSTRRATGPPWSWTDGPPRCGAAASAGRASPRWRGGRRARASWCRISTASSGSRASTRSSS